MEGAQENPPEPGSPALRCREPVARAPEVLPPEESEGCARPLEAAPKKLCGYLSKFGGKGPIRGWKNRWFFYDERKCHLYYSRTAQDANPLDSIDLSGAVFDCKADAEEGTFEIKTPGRIITLKVNGAVSRLESGMSSPGTAGRRRRSQSIARENAQDPDRPMNPRCPGLCDSRSAIAPSSSLGSHHKGRSVGSIVGVRKLSRSDGGTGPTPGTQRACVWPILGTSRPYFLSVPHRNGGVCLSGQLPWTESQGRSLQSSLET